MGFQHFGTFLLAAAFSLGPAIASAEYVYDMQADLSGEVGSFLSDLQESYRIADDVSFLSPVAIGGIEWSGVYRGSATRFSPTEHSDNFRIDIYRLADGAPAATPLYSHQVAPEQLTRTDTDFDAADGTYDIYSYSASLPTLRLGAGDYALSIANEMPADDFYRWHWITSTTGGDGIFRTYAGSGDWSTTWMEPHAASFALRGVTSVPEPASLATLAFCLTVGAGGAGRFWKRRKNPGRRAHP